MNSISLFYRKPGSQNKTKPTPVCVDKENADLTIFLQILLFSSTLVQSCDKSLAREKHTYKAVTNLTDKKKLTTVSVCVCEGQKIRRERGGCVREKEREREKERKKEGKIDSKEKQDCFFQDQAYRSACMCAHKHTLSIL